MKRILAFIVFVNIFTVANAQWFWQNPLPQGNTLYSVKFISATVGWAVGDLGTILKTTNGGTTWTLQTSGTTNNLWARANELAASSRKDPRALTGAETRP